MNVENKIAKAATITTAIVAVSGVGLVLRERSTRNTQREEELRLQRAKQLAEDSVNSGDFGIIFPKGAA